MLLSSKEHCYTECDMLGNKNPTHPHTLTCELEKNGRGKGKRKGRREEGMNKAG